MIQIYEPYLGSQEKSNVMKCLETNWISSQGEFIKEFEKQLAQYYDVKHAVVTSNCTTALHLSLKALDIKDGDEVICPDLTFIAPANAITLCGAKPVLVDVQYDTMNIDPQKIKQKITTKTKAIVVVHQFGHPADMDPIMKIANESGLKVIEDNAESPGAKYKGKMLGQFGDITCLSFFANKIMTSGEGGAILTNNSEVAELCEIMRDHGMSKQKRYHHILQGYNYRMTNLQAAIGVAQLEMLDETLAKRMKQLELYNTLLADIEGLSVRKFAPWCEPVHWLMTVTLNDMRKRDDCLRYMKDKGIDCRPMINPVHEALHYKPFYDAKDFPNSIALSRASLHLPSSLTLSNDELIYITNTLKQFLQGF